MHLFFLVFFQLDSKLSSFLIYLVYFLLYFLSFFFLFWINRWHRLVVNFAWSHIRLLRRSLNHRIIQLISCSSNYNYFSLDFLHLNHSSLTWRLFALLPWCISTCRVLIIICIPSFQIKNHILITPSNHINHSIQFNRLGTSVLTTLT